MKDADLCQSGPLGGYQTAANVYLEDVIIGDLHGSHQLVFLLRMLQLFIQKCLRLHVHPSEQIWTADGSTQIIQARIYLL